MYYKVQVYFVMYAHLYMYMYMYVCTTHVYIYTTHVHVHMYMHTLYCVHVHMYTCKHVLKVYGSSILLFFVCELHYALLQLRTCTCYIVILLLLLLLLYGHWMSGKGQLSKIYNPPFSVLKTGHGISPSFVYFKFSNPLILADCPFSMPLLFYFSTCISSQGGCFNSFYIYTCIV